ncbi:MAG: ABC transporter permease [Alphaproteobacteria bacterium]|nr:ABC transporter permease [Alphaproteobacteria bacterium]
MRLEPRAAPGVALSLAAPACALLAVLAVAALLIAAAGAPVGRAFVLMAQGALGSGFALNETLTRATPLILTGLAAAIAFRARLWNIGAEGQLYMGAVAATVLGTGAVALPPMLLIPLLIVAGALAGAAMLAGPTILKFRFGVDEVVTTLLLNFIVVLFVGLLLEGPLKDPMGLGWPQAEPIVAAGELPKLAAGKRLHAGFVLALALALAAWLIDARTTLGLRIRAVGLNAGAARFAGIPIGRTLLATALLSGGMAGIAGVSEVAGLKGNLTLDLSPGFGYGGIVVAMLARLHPLGVVAAAIFVAGIFVGADAMSRGVGVPNYIADVIVAASLLSMLVALLFTRYRLRRR